MGYRKRLIGIVGAGLLLSIIFAPQPKKEVPRAIDTLKLKEIHYLTDAELSLLYTCREEERVTNPDIIEVDYDEAQMLMNIAWVEHGIGSPEAQANVMKTVMNRVESDDFPNSIAGVILQGKQFSTVTCGKYFKATPDLDTHLALALLEQGKINHDALYFEASYMQDTWMSHHKTFLFESEGHRFYR